MATKKKATKEADGGEVLQKAAKAVGSALGAIAKKTGIAPESPKPPKKSGKLLKKAKSRLPRRQKKQAKKAAAPKAG